MQLYIKFRPAHQTFTSLPLSDHKRVKATSTHMHNELEVVLKFSKARNLVFLTSLDPENRLPVYFTYILEARAEGKL